MANNVRFSFLILVLNIFCVVQSANAQNNSGEYTVVHGYTFISAGLNSVHRADTLDDYHGFAGPRFSVGLVTTKNDIGFAAELGVYTIPFKTGKFIKDGVENNEIEQGSNSEKIANISVNPFLHLGINGQLPVDENFINIKMMGGVTALRLPGYELVGPSEDILLKYRVLKPGLSLSFNVNYQKAMKTRFLFLEAGYQYTKNYMSRSYLGKGEYTVKELRHQSGALHFSVAVGLTKFQD